MCRLLGHQCRRVISVYVPAWMRWLLFWWVAMWVGVIDTDLVLTLFRAMVILLWLTGAAVLYGLGRLSPYGGPLISWLMWSFFFGRLVWFLCHGRSCSGAMWRLARLPSVLMVTTVVLACSLPS